MISSKPSSLRLLFSFLFLFSFLILHGQNTSLFKGQVIDEKTQLPLQGVNVFDRTNSNGEVTDKNGEFELVIESFPAKVEFSYVGFESQVFILETIQKENRIIYLKQASSNLPEAEVKAVRPAIPITQKSRSVYDFKIRDGKIFLLSTTGTNHSQRLELRELDGQLLDTFSLAHLPGIKYFHQSCLGTVNLIHDHLVYSVQTKNNIIVGLRPPMKYEEYKIEVMPCVLSTPDFFYFRFNQFLNQVAHFKAFSKKEGHSFTLASFSDEKDIERYFDDMAWQENYLNNVIEGEIENPKVLEGVRNTQEDVDAKMQFHYQPVNVYLFEHENQLVFFDYLNGEIIFYSPLGKLLKSKPIKYHQEKKWEKNMLWDKKQERFYSVFEDRKGFAVHEINLANGSLEEAFVFDCDYALNMTVCNGYIYFLEAENDGRYLGANKVLRRVKV